MKTFKPFLLAVSLMTATVAQAGNVLYAEVDGKTMTLKCGDSPPEGSYVYDGTTGWKWGNCYDATTAIIDASCQSYSGNTLDYLFCDGQKLETITGLGNLNTSSVTSMEGMFLSCSELTSLDLSSFNTANVTNMCGMFWACSALTSLNLSGWNISNVTNLGMMFGKCRNLAILNLSGWRAASVTTR